MHIKFAFIACEKLHHLKKNISAFYETPLKNLKYWFSEYRGFKLIRSSFLN